MVAILIGVGHGHEKRVKRLPGAAAVGNRDVLGAVLVECRQHGVRVRGEAATGQAVEPAADLGVKTEAHGIEERVAFGDAGVDGHDAGGRIGEQRQGAPRLRGQAEMKRQPIARAARHEGESGRGADERLGGLVESAVPAHGDDAFASVGERLAGELRGVAWTFSKDDEGVEMVRRYKIPEGGHEPGTAAVFAGAGVEDESRLHAVIIGARLYISHSLGGCHGHPSWRRRVVKAANRSAKNAQSSCRRAGGG